MLRSTVARAFPSGVLKPLAQAPLGLLRHHSGHAHGEHDHDHDHSHDHDHDHSHDHDHDHSHDHSHDHDHGHGHGAMGALDEAGHSGPPPMVRHSKGKNHSGLQKQVFSLYRSYLRVAYEKQRLGEEGTVAFVRDRFRAEAHSVDRMNFHMIEYLLRKGERQVKQFKAAKNATYVKPAQH